MKWKIAIIAFVLILAALFGALVPQIAHGAPVCVVADAQTRLAQEPELTLIAARAGVSPILVACDKLAFDYNFGLANNYVANDPRWVASYWDRLNQFALSVNTPPPFAGDTVPTFDTKIRMPAIMRFRNYPP